MDALNVSATATGVRVSPRKAGEVAALVRGRTATEAITILEHTPRRAALPVSKLIKSAVANAEQKGMDARTLEISSISVGPGIAMKRFRPAAHGRALPYKKQSANIVVELAGASKPVKKTADKKIDTKKKATTTTKKNVTTKYKEA